MIALLTGKIKDKDDHCVVLDVAGVGYEVFVSARSMIGLGDLEQNQTLFIYTHYKSEGATLFGFLSKLEKLLFLALIKVDSVGPKTALSILSAAESGELIDLIEHGDVSGLAALPKISKKMAEHVVVKLKGKLSALMLTQESAGTPTRGPRGEGQRLRREAQAVLINLGYKTFEADRVLNEFDETIWTQGLEDVVRAALSQLGGGHS